MLDAATAQVGAWSFKWRTLLPVPLGAVILLVQRGSTSGALVILAGAVLVAAGESVRLWAVRSIGTISRTRAGRLGPLIDGGAYGVVRNPLYVGNWLLWTGFVLMSRLVWMLPVVWLAFLVVYGSIIRWEESRLREAFGADYDYYQRCTPRWVPTRRSMRNAGLSLPAHAWRDVIFSERGTLVAVAFMTVLLAIKEFGFR